MAGRQTFKGDGDTTTPTFGLRRGTYLVQVTLAARDEWGLALEGKLSLPLQQRAAGEASKGAKIQAVLPAGRYRLVMDTDQRWTITVRRAAR